MAASHVQQPFNHTQNPTKLSKKYNRKEVQQKRAPPASMSWVTTSTMSTERPKGEVPMPMCAEAPPVERPSDAGQSGPIHCGVGGLEAPLGCIGMRFGGGPIEPGPMPPLLLPMPLPALAGWNMPPGMSIAPL